MGERKVLAYPPLSFEPSELPTLRRTKKQQSKVRIMLPMSIVCNTCGNHIRQGAKLRSRKEEVVGETRLGIQRFRFYFKCTECSAVLTIKTYPQDPNCVVEPGATRIFKPLTPPRNVEPWRKQDQVVENEKRSSEAEEMGDVMNPLQNSTSDSKREMVPDELNSMKKSEDFVHRIEEKDFEDEEDLTQSGANNDESLNNAFKVSNALIVSIFASSSATFKHGNLIRTILDALCISSG
ncbi:hypothetical protein NL676_012397 [Syzygium grande]|nr:hypothetical protein NL676_012397 [Syzygium grande]